MKQPTVTNFNNGSPVSAHLAGQYVPLHEYKELESELQKLQSKEVSGPTLVNNPKSANPDS